MTITFPDTVDIIDSIRGAIGRDCNFVTATLSGCSACSLDPVTNTSTNSWCVVCSGEYWIPTYSGTLISGHITWGQADFQNWYTGGYKYDGDCRIQIKYTDENLNIVKACKYVEADGHTLEIKNRILRGVPTINRILLDCIEDQTD